MNISFKQVAKSLHLGVVAYRLYYVPKGLIQKYVHRDPIKRAIDEQARQQMEAATYNLKPIKNDPTAETYEIHFLSGKRFWYQTCFCAYSMALHSNINLRPVVYDDGTLENKYVEQIKRIFPDVKIIYLNEIEERLDQYLPISKFPYLRERRANYPNMRKLTDIHIGSSGWKLVLDSDMIFFQTPTFLINWLKSPNKPCHMVDVETSYGYSYALMTSLARAEIPQRLNVGICGLNSDEIDWEKLEFWCRTLIEKEGTHYYQEQAITAMIIAGKPCEIAPQKDYIVKPTNEEVVSQKGIVHHYVADSKPWYFRYAWKQIVNHQKKLE